MPPEGFLQRFHDLAEGDDEFRCAAALAVRKAVASEGAGANGAEDGDEEDLNYALKRLVRGIQSSRQSCRQGFSLALAELLDEFPGQLTNVLQLIRQHVGLQSGLRSGELKERLLGRLFAYCAILEGGCLRQTSADAAKSGKRKRGDEPAGAAAEVGAGLHEIYAARQYLRAPAAQLQAKVCNDLCAAGRAAAVAQALEKWPLDSALEAIKGNADAKPLDVHLAGLALDLRLAYEEAEKAGVDKSSMRSWPSCVRNDVLSQPATLRAFASALGDELQQASVGDAAPAVLGALCHWLVRSKETLQLSDIWEPLDAALFPEKAGSGTQAQALRALGEIAMRLHEAGAAASAAGKGERAEAVLVSFFTSMQRGMALLFQMLTWQKAHSHPAAIYSQDKVAVAVGAQALQPLLGHKANKKKKGSDGVKSVDWTLKDSTRLSILEALQKHKGFSTMKGTFQRRWQQALVAPLTTTGLRERCAALLEKLSDGLSRKGDAESVSQGMAVARAAADQIVQLATHGRAPDEVIMAALCLLTVAALFRPTGDVLAGAAYSLRSFREAAGISIADSDMDMSIPVIVSPQVAGKDSEVAASKMDDAEHWQLKLWATMTTLLRRTSPETAEKQLAAAGAAGGDADGEADGSGAILKTLAFTGCLSDGSLWLSRMHEWFDHVRQRSPDLVNGKPHAHGSPKKKKRGDSGSGLKMIQDFSEEDLALRARCRKICSTLLGKTEEDGLLPTRQTNALCGLPLAMIFGLLQSDDDDEQNDIRENLQEMVEKLEGLAELNASQGSLKKKAAQQRSAALATVPRVACEIFVNANGLTKEAARSAWRELGEYVSDETLTSLCASVCDSNEDDNDEADAKSDKPGDDAEEDEEESGEDDDEEEGNEDGAAAARNAARAAQFQQATARLAAARAAGEEGDEDGDEVMLGSDEVWQQLMEEDDGGDNSLLSAFASSGLNDEDATGPKMSKRQKRLRQRQEELTRKFREIELLEVFAQRFADKRPVTVTILRQLFEAMLAASRRAAGRGAGGEDGAKQPKADAQLRRIEDDLARRLSDVLAKTLKQISRSTVTKELCSWHTAEEWAEHARTLATLGAAPQASAAGQRAGDAGAAFLYWLCIAHRSAAHPSLGHDEAKGWDLAEELLRQALKDWSNKRAQAWCSSVFSVFASRAPHVLLRLPWLEQITESKNMYVQRTQVSLVSTKVLRGLPPDAPSTAKFAAGFIGLCSQLLEETVAADSANSASQRQKFRRELLRALCTATRATGRRRGGAGDSSAPALAADVSAKVVTVVKKVISELPQRRGEVYQLCLHLQRSLRPKDKEGGAPAESSQQEPASRPAKKQKKQRKED